MRLAAKPAKLGALGAVLVLAACQSAPVRAPVAEPRQTGIEGEWIDAEGVAVSTLRGGIFTSRHADTGDRLTEGTYTRQDQRSIQLDYYSRNREADVTANCLQVTQDRLNCTQDNGTQFTLTRYSGVS